MGQSQVWDRARREAARLRKFEWKVNLGSRISCRSYHVRSHEKV